jgi:nitrite reductase/ring-hydroxylating ferredoxin subunit
VIHTKQAAYRSYALALEVLDGSNAPNALIWDTEDPYHYVRRALGADGVPVLVVGGEDQKTGQDARPEEHWARLEAWAREHFSKLGRVVSTWSGQVLEPSDGLAFIGRNPSDTDNVFIVTGDSGHGMTHGTIAGILLPELMAGKEHPWATLYDPRRKSLCALPTFAKENLNVAAQYLQWVGPADVSDERVIPYGEGAVIREGLRLIAVYRDQDGTCQRLSAACPHLGAVVAWNAAEKTWDCPAHGSRFSTSGAVVAGPSTSGLTSAEPAEEPTGEEPTGEETIGEETTEPQIDMAPS